MELREQIARALNERLGGSIDEVKWSDWLPEADAVLEVLRQQQPVAWFEKSHEFDAWFLAYSCNPKAETRPLYAAPGAHSDLNLSCKSVQARLATQWGYVRRDDAQAAVPAGWQLVPSALIDAFPEINPSNYGHDDVCALNAWGVELVLAAAPKPEGK